MAIPDVSPNESSHPHSLAGVPHIWIAFYVACRNRSLLGQPARRTLAVPRARICRLRLRIGPVHLGAARPAKTKKLVLSKCAAVLNVNGAARGALRNPRRKIHEPGKRANCQRVVSRADSCVAR